MELEAVLFLIYAVTGSFVCMEKSNAFTSSYRNHVLTLNIDLTLQPFKLICELDLPDLCDAEKRCKIS